ncbi:MAG: hypothetical protein P4M00_23920 [Azospirillaceae bacterium]|nr:hypothetical protein [Azospirillaceae bacterium]
MDWRALFQIGLAFSIVPTGSPWRDPPGGTGTLQSAAVMLGMVKYDVYRKTSYDSSLSQEV